MQEYSAVIMFGQAFCFKLFVVLQNGFQMKLF